MSSLKASSLQSYVIARWTSKYASKDLRGNKCQMLKLLPFESIVVVSETQAKATAIDTVLEGFFPY